MNNPLIKRVLFCLNSQKLNEIIANKHKKKIKQEIFQGGQGGSPLPPIKKNNRGTSWLDRCLCLFLESTCKSIPQIIYRLARSISTARIFLLCHQIDVPYLEVYLNYNLACFFATLKTHTEQLELSFQLYGSWGFSVFPAFQKVLMLRVTSSLPKEPIFIPFARSIDQLETLYHSSLICKGLFTKKRKP